MSEDDYFFILSLRWTRENYATWWCPNNSGYTSIITEAGRYSRSAVESNASYYNNGITTLAIQCSEVEKVAQSIVFDYAMMKLVEPKRLVRASMPGDDQEECSHCGYSSPPVNIGLRVAGDLL